MSVEWMAREPKSEPFVINRPQIIDRIYHGWYDEKDGSYHEILIENEE